MFDPILILASPQSNTYDNFLDLAISKFGPSTRGVAVIVTAHLESSSRVNEVLSSLYTQIRATLLASKFSYNFNIDVYVNKDIENVNPASRVFYVLGETIPSYYSRCNLIGIEVQSLPISITSENALFSASFGSISRVAVGGTFDHLHDGHKILLSMATFVAKKSIIIGVTGPELLQNKKYPSQLESLETRIKRTGEFLRKVLQPSQSYQIYEIRDVCGPTGYLSGIDALIISEETSDGATYVNDRRVDLGFLPLKVLKVNVIGGKSSAVNNWEGKLSSTDIRRAEYERKNVSIHETPVCTL